jgi:hypothetical protein
MTVRVRFIVMLPALLICIQPRSVGAHDGPPYPIVSDRVAGPYRISIWTDPDATADGSAGGHFWVIVERHDNGDSLTDIHATVAVRPLDRDGMERTATAEPVRGNSRNQFAALVMDHEGPFAVRVVVSGPLGSSALDSKVDATYDLRPPAYMLAVYAMPFVLAGLLWTRLLLRRRHAAAGTPNSQLPTAKRS